jgi:DNA polymerase-3 subunit gamma/tau
MAELAAKCTPAFIYKAMDLCNTADMNFRNAANKQFLVELTLIKLCQAVSPSPGISGEEEGQRLKPIAAAPKPQQQQQPRPQPQPAPKPIAPAPAPAPKPIAPRPMPAPAPAPTPQQVKTGLSIGPGISIRPGALSKSAAKADDAATATSTSLQQHRSNPYTNAAIDVAWENYAQSNPAAIVLVSTMRSCRPRRTEADTFLVAVESPAQEKTLLDNMGAIRTYVRNKLQNDSINFLVEIVQGEGSPRTWTEREVLEHMMSDHPAVHALVDTLKLTLD